MGFAFFRTLIAAVACVCVLQVIASPAARANTVAHSFRDGVNPGKLNGVWRSRGYGWLLTVEDGGVQFYDESRNLCVENAESDEELTKLAAGFQITDDGGTIRLARGDASYLYTFDKIDALPEKCLAGEDSTPNSVLESFIDIFTRHYAFFKTRNIDWPAITASARKRVTADTTSSQLLEVIQDIISKFEDAHVILEAHIDDESVVLQSGAGKTRTALAAQAGPGKSERHDLQESWLSGIWRRDIGETLLRGKGRTAANGNIKYGLIDGDIGYIAIRAMEGFAAHDSEGESGDLAATDKAMDDALAFFGDARAVIVDVAINDGGYDTVARRIAGRFAAKRTLGFYKYAGDAKGDEPQAIYVEPSKKRRFTGPVYLLTSDVTVSAAEILVLSMRVLPNVTHIGAATRGALSDQLWKTLPNGWSLSLSNEVYLDADRKLWEGSGIPPQVPLEVFSKDDVSAGYLKAVYKIVELAQGGMPKPMLAKP